MLDVMSGTSEVGVFLGCIFAISCVAWTLFAEKLLWLKPMARA